MRYTKNLFVTLFLFLVCSTSTNAVKDKSVETMSLTPDLNFGQPVGSLAFSNDGEMLAAGGGALSSRTTVAKVWSTSDWRLKYEVRSAGKFLDGMVFSPSSRVLAVATSDLKAAEILFVDARTGKEIGKFTVRAALNPRVDNAISGLAFSPDEKTMAISQASGEVRQIVRLLSIEDFSNISVRDAEISASSAKNISLTFSPDGKLLAWVSVLGTYEDAGKVSVVDLATGKKCVDKKQFDRGTFASFSRDGKLLAVAGMKSDDNTKLRKGSLILYDTRTWEEIGVYEKNSFEIEGLQFTSDGRFLGVATTQEEGRGYEVAFLASKSLQPFVTRSAATGSITAFAISPDGEFVLVGDAEGKVKIVKVRP